MQEVSIGRLFAEDWVSADTAWLRDTAAKIDRTSGNNNGKLGFSEVDAYVAKQRAVLQAPDAPASEKQRASVRIENAEWAREALVRAQDSSSAAAAVKEAVASVARGVVHAGVWAAERIGAMLGLIKPI